MKNSAKYKLCRAGSALYNTIQYIQVASHVVSTVEATKPIEPSKLWAPEYQRFWNSIQLEFLGKITFWSIMKHSTKYKLCRACSALYTVHTSSKSCCIYRGSN